MPYPEEKNNEKNPSYSSINKLDIDALTFVPIAYDTLLKRNELIRDSEDLQSKVRMLETYSTANAKRNARDTIGKMDSEEINNKLLDYVREGYLSRNEKTDNRVISLVYQLLDIKDGDSIFDLGCSDGSFLASIYENAKVNNITVSNIYGIEMTPTRANFASVGLSLICGNDTNVEIVSGNVFRKNPFTYNKGYVYPSVGLHQVLRSENFYSLLYPEIRFQSSLDEQWLYIDRLLAGLKGDDVRAVALVFSKSLMRTSTNEYLQKLLNDGWIEQIIPLPREAMPNLAAATYLIVFSRGNKKVEYVTGGLDEYFKKEQEWKKIYFEDNTSSKEEYMRAFYNAARKLESDTEEINGLTIKWLEDRLNKTQIRDGVVLKSVADIEVGSQYTVSSFHLSDENTGYKILTSSDIENGMIRWGELKSIIKENSFRDNIFAHKNDVIITSKSTKVKVAVITEEPEDRVIVTGGMIIIRPNTTRLNPIYLKLYLESEQGQNALTSIQTGSVIVHLSPKLVGGLQIPLPSIEKQKEKAQQYVEISSSIESLQKQIDELNKKLKDIKFVEEEDEEHAMKE